MPAVALREAVAHRVEISEVAVAAGVAPPVLPGLEVAVHALQAAQLWEVVLRVRPRVCAAAVRALAYTHACTSPRLCRQAYASTQRTRLAPCMLGSNAAAGLRRQVCCRPTIDKRRDRV